MPPWFIEPESVMDTEPDAPPYEAPTEGEMEIGMLWATQMLWRRVSLSFSPHG